MAEGTGVHGAPVLAASSSGQRKRRRRPVGQRMFEYALVAILVVVVAVLSLGVLGHQVQEAFSNVSRGLSQ